MGEKVELVNEACLVVSHWPSTTAKFDSVFKFREDSSSDDDSEVEDTR